MYAIKEAVITKEHLPAAESAVFYTDIRAQGKDFDLYYERAKKDYGVRFIRSQISRIAERPQSGNLARRLHRRRRKAPRRGVRPGRPFRRHAAGPGDP